MHSESEIELLRATLAERRRQAAADHAAEAVARANGYSSSLIEMVMRLMSGEPTRLPAGLRAALSLQGQVSR